VHSAYGTSPVRTAGRQRLYFELRLRLRADPGIDPSRASETFSVREAVEKFAQLIILGDPGSGKTTALQNTAGIYAREFANMRTKPGWASKIPVPIYVSLSDFALCAGDTPLTRVYALVRLSLARHSAAIGGPDLEEIFRHYRMCLLLDGYSEIGDEAASCFAAGMRDFLNRHSPAIVVVASRIQHFRANLPSSLGLGTASTLDVLELTYPDGIEEFVLIHLGQSLQSTRLARELRSRLPLRRMATNPLLLTLIIRVFQTDGKLPSSRGKLLERTAAALLERHSPEYRFEAADKCILLGYLAMSMKRAGLRLSIANAVSIIESATLQEAERASSFPFAYRPLDKSLTGAQLDAWALIVELKQQEMLIEDAGGITFWH